MAKTSSMKDSFQPKSPTAAYAYDGVLITHSDLMAARSRSSRNFPTTLFIKPLSSNDGYSQSVNRASDLPLITSPRTPIESVDRTGDNHNRLSSYHRRIKPLLQDSITRQSTSGSPSLLKNNRSHFDREANSRQSLGGTSNPSFCLWDDSDHTGAGNNPAINSIDAPDEDDVHRITHIRVSMLPSLDELGYALDSFTDPQTGHFMGLRICERFRNPQLHLPREHCSLLAGDIIVMVNRHKLANMHESQAIRYVYNAFRDARQYTVEFGVYRHNDRSSQSPSTPFETTTLPGRLLWKNFDIQTDEMHSAASNPHQPKRTSRHSRLNTAKSPPMDKTDRHSKPDVPTKISAKSGRKSTDQLSDSYSPATSPLGNHQRSMSSHSLKHLNLLNTRTIGRKISVDLVKLVDGGLGFTLTSRDTHIGDPETSEPVYVKKILSSGAAISDGRLLVGDRLLSVDGVEVECLDQVSSQLRRITAGRSVFLVVSRQTPILVDDTTVSKAVSGMQTAPHLPPRPFTSFTFEFPLLPNPDRTNRTPPSLGANFKWTLKPPNDVGDGNYSDSVGLYVVSLLPNGILADVGRETLVPGDRLVGVNGENLDGMNSQAIIAQIKHILTDEENASSPQSPSASRTFNLTVHRYHTQDDKTGASSHYSNLQLLCVEPNDSSPSDTSRNSPADQLHSPIHVRDSRRNRKYHGENSLYPGHTTVEDGPGDRYSLSVPGRYRRYSYFDREGFGRRSVSEKRHGHIDPIQFEIFQTNVLSKRDNIPLDASKKYASMPTTRRLKMHRERVTADKFGPVKALHPDDKSCAQPIVPTEPDAGRQRPDDELPPTIKPRFHRGTKQNSSFRSAVDRSLSLATSEPTSSSHLSTVPLSAPNSKMFDVAQSNIPSSSSKRPPMNNVHSPPKFDSHPSLPDHPIKRPSSGVKTEPKDVPKPDPLASRTNTFQKRFDILKGLFKRNIRSQDGDINPSSKPKFSQTRSNSIDRQLSLPECTMPNAPIHLTPPNNQPNGRTRKISTQQNAKVSAPIQTREQHGMPSGRKPLSRGSNNVGPQSPTKWLSSSNNPPPLPPRTHISHEQHVPTSVDQIHYNSYKLPPRKTGKQPTSIKPPLPESTYIRSPKSGRSVPSRDHSPVYIPKQPSTRSDKWITGGSRQNSFVHHSDLNNVHKQEAPIYKKHGSDRPNLQSSRNERSSKQNSTKSRQSIGLPDPRTIPTKSSHRNSSRPTTTNPIPVSRSAHRPHLQFSPSPSRVHQVDDNSKNTLKTPPTNSRSRLPHPS